MKTPARRVVLAAAAASHASAAPGAAYTTLTTLFGKLKTEAKDTFETKTPELAEHNADCATALKDHADEIQKLTDDKVAALVRRALR